MPVSEAEARLGQLLFYDPILSGNRNISCATCHHPRFATSDGVSLGLGEGSVGLGPDRQPDPENLPEQRIPRNAPALFNLGARGFTVLFHDGRALPGKRYFHTSTITTLPRSTAFSNVSGWKDEVQVNIEQGHAILAGHSFEHEIALATSLGLFGSIDMNRNDYQSGWDTDQFPDSVPEMAKAYYEIIRAGGFTTGGTNFDAKLRRQSLDPEDLVLAHVGAMDVCARAFKSAAAAFEDGALAVARSARYSGWDKPDKRDMLTRGSLETIYADVVERGLDPAARSGRQERLENIWNRFV